VRGASTTRPRLPEKYFLPLRERERETESEPACAGERRARRDGEGGEEKRPQD